MKNNNLLQLSNCRKKIFDMKKKRVLHEGKAKIIYEGPQPGTLIQYFKDDATAFNKVKHAVIEGKGVLNNRISAYIMSALEENGIRTHFIRRENMREQLIKALEIIPIEVVVRRYAAGSFCKRFGAPEGLKFETPMIEFFYKNDALGDPMITAEHIFQMNWAEPEEIDEIASLAIRICDYLAGMFAAVNLRLVDFKLEFGRLNVNEDYFPEILLADEISPDNCRITDMKSGQSYDKDLFRNESGDLIEGYREVARRLGVLNENDTDSDHLASVTCFTDGAARVRKKRKKLY